MANINNSVLAGIRGKIGPYVGSNWRNSAVLRKRVTPSNPRTEAQLEQRGYMVNNVNGIKELWTLDPACKADWSDWAQNNTFPNGKNLPAWQACLKVMNGLSGFDIYSDPGVLPTTAPQDVPLETGARVTVTAVDNTLKYAWDAIPNWAGNQMQLWVCGPISPIASARPQQGRLVAIVEITGLSHIATTFFTMAGLTFGATANYCVWARMMKESDSVPGNYAFMGSFELTMP